MNIGWRTLAPLLLIGPALGVLIILGVIPRNMDRWLWAVVVLVSGWRCARREPERALFHGALAGFWNGATSTLLQAIFRDALLANNAWIREHFARQPAGFDLDYHLYMLVPFIGVAGAGFTGLVAMWLARARKRPLDNA